MASDLSIDFIQTKPEITPWLMSAEFMDRVEALRIKHGFQEHKRTQFDSFVRDICMEKIPDKKMIDIAKVTLLVSQEESKMIVRDVLGELVLPIALYYSVDPFTLLDALGGDAIKYHPPMNMKEVLQEMMEIEQDKQQRTVIEELYWVLHGPVQSSSMSKPASTQVEEVEMTLQEKLATQYRNVLTDDIKHAQHELSALYTTNESAFISSLYTAINARDVAQVVGGLLVLAARGSLTDLLEKDKKIQKLYSAHLAKKFDTAISEDFQNHPTKLVYVSYFLQHLLMATLKLSESESAALAVHMLNHHYQATGQVLDMIAYGDAQTQQFQWNTIVQNNGTLEIHVPTPEQSTAQ